MRRRFVPSLSLSGFGLGLLLSCAEATRRSRATARSRRPDRPGSAWASAHSTSEGKVSPRVAPPRGFATGDPIHLSAQVTAATEWEAPLARRHRPPTRAAAGRGLAWARRRGAADGQPLVPETLSRSERQLPAGRLAIRRAGVERPRNRRLSGIQTIHASRARIASLLGVISIDDVLRSVASIEAHRASRDRSTEATPAALRRDVTRARRHER